MEDPTKVEINKLIKHRGVIKGKQTLFKNYLVNFKSSVADISPGEIEKKLILELEKRLEKFNILLTNFEEVQGKIGVSVDSFEEQLSERSLFENIYFKLHAE